MNPTFVESPKEVPMPIKVVATNVIQKTLNWSASNIKATPKTKEVTTIQFLYLCLIFNKQPVLNILLAIPKAIGLSGRG